MAARLIAFHNDQSVKDRYLARVAAHRAADELIHAAYAAYAAYDAADAYDARKAHYGKMAAKLLELFRTVKA